MFRKVKLLYSFFTDDYHNHLIRSKASYYTNYWKLFFLSFFTGKIVVISLIEHIGDIIANEPVSRAIREKHPHSTIIWVVRKPYIDLVRHNPNIDRVITVYCLTSWILIQKKFIFEAVYDLHFNGRTCKTCQVTLVKENSDDSINGMNYLNYGGLLKAVCLHNKIEVKNTYPEIYIPDRIISKSKKLIPEGKYVVVHCTSNEPVKDWEGRKWNGLAKNITGKKIHILEVGSKKQIEIESEYFHDLCGKISILESAAVIKEASVFIGIDSGPAHMANALRVPGIILLGEYYYGMKNYNPFSGSYGEMGNSALIQSEGQVKDIPEEQVIDSLNSLFVKNTSAG